MTKKILAVVLAVIMAVCVIPFSVSADQELVSADARVAGWNSNFSLLTVKLLDNENSAHWKYVAENNKEISDTMLTYTAFALYDDAWKNGFDKSVSVETAKEVLLTLIEKVDAGVGPSKFNEILKVLKTATSLKDLVEKADKIVDLSTVVDSAAWKTAFSYIETAIKLGDLYEETRDEVIEAYAKILSVQAANKYYLEYLQYICDTCPYTVLRQAASELKNDINESVESIIKKEVLKASGFTASNVLNTAARIAMNSNSYTAVALKVYDIGTSVADVLWNTSDQYVLMDELYTSFYAETAAVDWAKAAKLAGNAEWYEFAVATVLGIRETGAQALYDLKVAQNEGAIGAVLNQINYNISFEYIEEFAFLELAKKVLFDLPLADYKPISSVVTINTNAIVKANGTLVSYPFLQDDTGYYSVYNNDYTHNQVKTIFSTDNTRIDITNSTPVFVTSKTEVLAAGQIEDWSFTNEVVDKDIVISYDTLFVGGYTYQYIVLDNVENRGFNEEFVYPPYNEVNAATVAEAVVQVVKDEIEETIEGKVVSLKELIDSIFAKLKEMFFTIFNFLKIK